MQAEVRRRMAELQAQRETITLDPTPPPDHAEFLAARAAGFRSMRRNHAEWRKRAIGFHLSHPPKYPMPRAMAVAARTIATTSAACA